MATDMEVINLICPNCENELERKESLYYCKDCSKEYPLRDGIVCFLDSDDTFYEGAYTATTNITFRNDRTSLKARLFFDVYRDPYFRAIRKYTKSVRNILDLGCGGGVRYLAQKGDAVGIDLSYSSLKKVSDVYKLGVQADALKMPFPDDTFDLLISSYNFEHYLPNKKSNLLAQAYRVLKPGGYMILLFDCDNNNVLFRYLKTDEKLYKKSIVEHDKHYGLELAGVNLARIKEAGFSIVEFSGLNKSVLQYLPVYGWLASYGDKSLSIKILTRIILSLSKRRPFWIAYTAFVNWFDMLMTKILPLDHSRVLLVIAYKKGDAIHDQ